MANPKRIFSPALFGLIIICFMLPFVSISCGGTEVANLHGIDFITGASEQGQDMDPNPLAIIALASAVIGLAVGFWGKKTGNIIAALTGISGLITSLILKSGFDDAVMQDGGQTQWFGGYYATLILFAAAALLNIYMYFQRRQEPLPTAWSYDMPPNIPQPGSRVCSQCGARVDTGQGFCTQCGNRLSAPPEIPIIPPENPVPHAVVEKNVPLPENPVPNTVVEKNTPLPDSPVVPVAQQATISGGYDMTRVLRPALIPVLKIDRSGQEEIIRIDKDQFIIGRKTEEVDYSEKSSNAVSRKHAQIIKENGSCYILDLNSQNGTFVNEQRLEVEQRYMLQANDTIRLADVIYIFDEI